MATYVLGSNPFKPRELLARYPRGHGLKPSAQAINSLIDTTDPAWPAVAGILREFAEADIELDATAVKMATQLGRRRWSTADAQDNVQPTLAAATSSIVYYIRRGALIKIGTTANPETRFAELLPDEILAVEPGGRKLESERHRQFSHLRLRPAGEYFEDAVELLNHIREIRAMYGEPDPSWPTVGPAERWALPLATSTDTLTAAEAEKQLGIKQVTIRAWRHKGRIEPAGVGEQGRFYFYREHLIRLRDSPHRRMRQTLKKSPGM